MRRFITADASSLVGGELNSETMPARDPRARDDRRVHSRTSEKGFPAVVIAARKGIEPGPGAGAPAHTDQAPKIGGERLQLYDEIGGRPSPRPWSANVPGRSAAVAALKAYKNTT